MGPRINDRIRVREVRVVDENNEQLGVMEPREALILARERGLDLIEVAPSAQPPVCRIMDYGKYKYEQGKREREAAKKQRHSEMKGMTMRPNTDDHDLDIKTKNIVKFLGEGDKVKVTVRFRSREMAHPEFAQRSLKRIEEAVVGAGVGFVERIPLMEGRQMIMILAPGKDAAKEARKPAAAPRPAGDARPAVPAAVPQTAPVPQAATATPPVSPPPSEVPSA